MPDPLEPSRPWLGDAQLAPYQIDAGSGGIYQLPVDDQLVLRVSCATSGNGGTAVRLIVDWGDGSTSGAESSVRRVEQFVHNYLRSAPYRIAVRAINSDGVTSRSNLPGEVPNPLACFSLTVVDRQSVIPPATARWVGLGLPGTTLGSGIAAVQEVLLPVTTTLSGAATAGQRSISVASMVDQFVSESIAYISQAGRAPSIGRVTKTIGSTVYLDAALLDNYTVSGATVELRRSVLTTNSSRVELPPSNWVFPKSEDVTLVRSSIRMLLATKRGERVMRPTTGSNLHRIPFEQNDVTSGNALRQEVVDVIQLQEPRATVRGVKTSRKDNDVQVSAVISLAGSPDQFDVTFMMTPTR